VPWAHTASDGYQYMAVVLESSEYVLVVSVNGQPSHRPIFSALFDYSAVPYIIASSMTTIHGSEML